MSPRSLWRWPVAVTALPLAVLALSWCDPFGGEVEPSGSADGGDRPLDGASDVTAAEDDSSVEPDPEPVDPGDEPTLPPLPDGGCVDAAFSESFDVGFLTSWSTTAAAGGSIGLDTAAWTAAPSSLRAQVSSAPSNFAWAGRRTCPMSGTLVCTFDLRIDTVAEGDIGIVDLRGIVNGAEGPVVARLKAREIMFLSPGDGGQRVDRMPIDLLAQPRGKFRKTELEVTSSTFAVRVEGNVLGELSVPAAGFSLQTVRAGVVYMTGQRSPGWDLRIDELSCSSK